MEENPESPREDWSVRLGQLALEKGLITAEDLRAALVEQSRGFFERKPPKSLAQILVEKGLLREEQLAQLLAEKTGPPRAPSHAPLGKYEIVRELGRGGMGVVYEAIDTQLRRKVALKTLLPSVAADPQETQMDEERFLREARLSANLAKHPNVVGIYEAGVVDGRRYLAMEFVDGLPMSKWRKAGSITIRQQVKLLRDVALAVHHAHRQNVIHRDLKPDNILIDPQGQPHVTDFGLAKSVGQNVRVSLTASGMIVGTPAYMSPEQAIGEKNLDHRTDVYAIGVMLYETLTGRLPFTGETAIEILMKAAKNPVPPPSYLVKPGTNPTLDRAIESVCLKALAKNPRDRYATAEALANDLTRWLKGEKVKVVPAPTRRMVPKKGAKPPWLRVAAGTAAVLAALGYVLLGGSSPSTDRGPADRRPAESDETRRKKERKKEIDRLLAEARDRLREGKLAEASALFDEVLRKDHANEDAASGKDGVKAKEIEAELAKADALLKDGKFREAFRAYGLVCAKDPANRRAPAGVEESQKRMEEAIVRAKEQELQAKSDADRAAAEQRRKEEEEANRRAQEQLKQAQAQLPAARVRDMSRRTFTEHEAPVWDVAVSPDGKLLASGSVDRTIRLLDLAKGVPMNRIAEGSGVFGLAFSKDGKRLASANVDSTIKLWDVVTGRELQVLRGHEKAVNRITFSPDGTQLASMSADGTAKLWDLARGAALYTFPALKDKTMPAPVFLARGKILACGSGESSIKFFGVKTGSEARAPTLHEGLSSLAASPDGTILASGGWNHQVILWDAETGKMLRRCEGDPGGVWSLAFSPDGRFLASGGHTRAIALWDVASGTLVDTLVGHEGGVHAVAFLPDGKQLASGSGDGTVRLWNVEAPAGEEAWKKSIDLLALVDPRRDALRGTWRKEGGRLVSEPFGNGTLRLPYEAPEEYDFRIVFTRTNAACATAQFFVHQGRPGIWDLNKPGVGFSNVAGVYSRENATFSPFSIQDGTRYVSMIQVRRDGVRGWIDRKRHSQWLPSMGQLSTGGEWSMDLPNVLGIGNCETLTTFESIQVLEVTGKGRLRTSPLDPRPAPAVSPASGLVAHWRLNESSGAAAADSSGNKLAAKMTAGAGWEKEKSGGVRLDGKNGFLEIPTAAAIDKLREGSYSLSLWFKPEAVGVAELGYPLVRLPWFTLYQLAKSHVMMQHAIAGETFGTAMAPEGSSPAGTYHHVVGTVDRKAGSTRLYLAGKSVADASWPADTAARAVWPGVYRIGIVPGTDPTAGGAKGAVDSVRLYNRALSAAEVEALYRSELPAHEK